MSRILEIKMSVLVEVNAKFARSENQKNGIKISFKNSLFNKTMGRSKRVLLRLSSLHT